MFTFSGAGSYSFSRSDEYKPDLILLSEPQIFQRDLGLLSKPFLGQYSFLLNSEENSNSDLALESPKAFEGTLIMWRSDLDPYVLLLSSLYS